MKKIAIVGSSGGNLYNLGGKDPKRLLEEIITQAASASLEVTDILFVGASDSLDRIKKSTQARVFEYDHHEISNGAPDSLERANARAVEKDRILAEKIRADEVDALVVMSPDPNGINRASFAAAISRNLPIVGTGGTSMAHVQAGGGNVLAVSGTTGTTNRTRAISAVAALSKHFGVKYRPVIGSGPAPGSRDKAGPMERISVRGIMLASIPGFIAMALILAVSKIPFLSTSLSPVFDLLINALPVVVAVVAAKQVSGLEEVGMVAGVIAGVLSVSGGILGGIAGGILAGTLASFLIMKAFEWKFPATTANIIAGGLAGLVAGLIVYFLLAPVTLAAGEAVRNLINLSLGYNAALAGLLAGLLIWPAIIGGAYHAAILPIVLLEMEKTGMSFLGAVDMAGLVMVSAGITLANIVVPRERESRSIAAPGFFVNMAFGTFVEAAYPFMFSSKLIFAAAVFSSGAGGLLIGLMNVKGTAYVPSLAAPGLSNNPAGFAVSMAASLLIAMLLTIAANKVSGKKVSGKKG